MHIAKKSVLALAGALALSATPQAWAFVDSRASLADGSRIPLEVAIQEAKAIVPGQAIDAEISQQNGRAVYEVQILDPARQTHSVFVDARSGEVLTAGHFRGPVYWDSGTMAGAPRDSQPGMTGTNAEDVGTNSGTTEDGGSGDRSHADQNQGGRS